MAFKFSTRLREAFINLTGYWLYKHKELPTGCNFFSDLRYKIGFPLNVVFDVGANIGQTALGFDRYTKAAAIYSFEPVTKTFQQLVANTKSLPQVKCFHTALGEKEESVEINLFDDKTSFLNSLKKDVMNKDNSMKETIKVIKGDDFCKQHTISQIDLLKIDTEGYEMQVLQGFSQMISESKIKSLYCEVGLYPDNHEKTYLNDLMTFAYEHNFMFFGLYDVTTWHTKAKANYGNIFFVHNSVLDMVIRRPS